MRNRSVTHSEGAIFQALADPTRRALLDLLCHGSRHAGEIAGEFRVSRPAISRHLSRLRRARLVQERREGRHRIYQLSPGPLRVIDSWLDQYRSFWATNLTSLKTFVESEYAKEKSRTHAVKRNYKTKKRKILQ